MTRFRSAEEVHRAVSQRLRRPPQPRVWAVLIEDGRIDDVVNAISDEDQDEALAELFRQIERDEGLLRGRPTRSGAGFSREIVARRNPKDERAFALARVLAAEAAQLPEVAAFRRNVLGGRLLRPEQIAAWIVRQTKTQGGKLRRPTCYVRVPLSDSGELAVWRPRSGFRYEVETLSYPPGTGAWTNTVPIRANTALACLKFIARQLERAFGWKEATAIAFALTDIPPVPTLGAVTLKRGSRRAADRIQLEVSPRLGPRQIAKLYSGARSGALFGREASPEKPCRALTKKHTELGVFAARVNDGRSWRDALKEWNTRNGRCRYNDVRTFTRDCRHAYQRITGDQLKWRGARNRRNAREDAASVHAALVDRLGVDAD